MIKVKVNDKEFNVNENTTPLEIAKKISYKIVKEALAVKINGKLSDLTTPLKNNCELKFIYFKDPEGKEVLNHSAAHVLAKAVLDLFPKAKLTIGPAIENGFYYDIYIEKPFTSDDLVKISKKMEEIIKKDLPFKKVYLSKEKAKKFYKNNKFKLEILEEIKDKEVSFYKLGEDFMDLCKGPHVPSSKYIKAFKLTKLSGSYWRGDANKEQLQRIYGVAFPKKSLLEEYLKMLEEAEKRDHRKLGKQMDLFSFHEEAPGMPFWHPKGLILFNILVNFWRKKHKDDYIEIKTPILLNRKLWETSGHWRLYKENMFITKKYENQQYAVKPMNCPGGIIFYKSKPKSYRDLPLRVGEIGLVHRRELSGTLHGLFRVVEFTQDDAHIYCTSEQLESEIIKVVELMKEFMRVFGFNKYHFELSVRSEKKKNKYLGTDKEWKFAEDTLANALKKLNIPFIRKEGEAKFYGPSLDLHLVDSLGRTWQCGTIQLDFNLPKRFNIEYIDKDNKPKTPFMLHRVMYGSIERFIGILLEHYAGKLPLWLAPTQIKIITVSEKHEKYANKVLNILKKEELRVETDFSPNTVEYKIRNSQLEKIPYVIVIGEKEEKNNTIAVRTLDGKVKFNVNIKEFVKGIKEKIKANQ